MKLPTAILALMSLAASAGERITADAQWLEVRHAQLAAIKNSHVIQRSKFGDTATVKPGEPFTYFVHNGLIVFPDKSWAVLISHSVHVEDGLSDLTIIRTAQGYFVNKGHCCSNLLLKSDEKISSLDSFLKTKGMGPKGAPVEWEPYKSP